MKCNKTSSQQEAVLKFGEWYCSVECMPTEEELYMRLARMEL